MLNEAAYQEATGQEALGTVGRAVAARPLGKAAKPAEPAKAGPASKVVKATKAPKIATVVASPKTAKAIRAAQAGKARWLAQEGTGASQSGAAEQPLAAMRADAQAGVLPLDMLCRAQDNVRTRGSDEADGIPALAELIFSFGLINPLSVVDKVQATDGAAGEGQDGGGDHRFPVAAGDRRLRALQLLASQGRIRPDEPIEVRRFPSHDALALSLAENTSRLDMHPVDQYEAFRKLVEVEGKTIEAVADAYGVSALTVRRRLALARVAPELLELFRTGGIAQDQLQVLALLDDHATQVHIWHAAPSYARSAYHLRSQVLASEVSARDHRAVFVGVDAYTAAGGALRSDFFSDQDGTYLEDVVLLDRLYAEKLEAETQRLRDDGWAWVEVVDNLHSLYNFHRAQPTLREATADEAAQMSELELRLDSLDERLEKLRVLIEEAQERDEDDALDDQLYDEQEALEEQRSAVELQRDALRDRRKVFTPEARAISGVRITARSGVLEMVAGLIRDADLVQATPEAGSDGDGGVDGDDDEDQDADGTVSVNGVAVEVSRYARNTGGSSASGDGGTGGSASKAKPEFSEKVVSDLSAHRTGALQAALLDHPRAALATLALALLSQDERGDYRASVPAQIRATTCGHALRQKASGYDDSRAGQALRNAEAQMYVLLGLNQEDRSSRSDSGAVFARLLALDLEALVELLTYLTARTVDVIGPRPAKPDNSDQLADALMLDMADYWEAGSDNFFIHVPKAKAIEAVTQARSAQDAGPMAKMKKAEAATAAATLVAGRRWLPVPLRPAGAAGVGEPSGEAFEGVGNGAALESETHEGAEAGLDHDEA